MVHLSKFIFGFLSCFNKKIDTHTLHNIKHILVFTPIWTCFFLFAITMQVNRIYFIECLQ